MPAPIFTSVRWSAEIRRLNEGPPPNHYRVLAFRHHSRTGPLRIPLFSMQLSESMCSIAFLLLEMLLETQSCPDQFYPEQNHSFIGTGVREFQRRHSTVAKARNENAFDSNHVPTSSLSTQPC